MPQPKGFGLRREAKRYAALEWSVATEKRCRRCALPPQSKTFKHGLFPREHRLVTISLRRLDPNHQTISSTIAAGEPEGFCHAAKVISSCFPQRSTALCRTVTALLMLTVAWNASAAQPPESGDAAVVIYNSRLAESKAVAEHYATQRGVPTNQVLGLSLPTREEITRTEFNTLLQEPLFDWLVHRGMFTLGQRATNPTASNLTTRIVGSRVRYAVLCYGVPLKIQNDPTLNEPGAASVHPHLRRNEAAVDSELVCLPRLRENLMLAGLVTNAFYGTAVASGLHPTNGVLLVARLDGPTPEIARGLVDKAMQAERDGLWGRAYVDMRGIKEGGYKIGDQVMHDAAQACGAMGYDVVVDLSPETFPAEFPLSQVAIYAGWYSGNVCGPFTRPEVEFMPGAFAYHLHSFSAATVRSGSAHWVGPLLAKGATITLGSVYEPYLAGTSEVAALLRSLLLGGFSFGEAAWSAEYGFSWQTTVLGDPLYRPYCRALSERHDDLEKKQSPLREWSHAMFVDRALAQRVPANLVADQLAKLPLTKTSAVLSEKLADVLRLQGQAVAAITVYDQALDLAPTPQQKVRLFFALAGLQDGNGQGSEALKTLKRFLAACPDYPAKRAVWERMLANAKKLGNDAAAAEAEALLNPKPGPGP